MPEENVSNLERALAALAPAQPRWDRDGVLFRAGQAAAPPSKAWPLVAFATATLALGLALFMALRPAPAPVIHFVHVRMAPPPSPGEPVAPAMPVEQVAPFGPMNVPPFVVESLFETGATEHVPVYSCWSLQQQALRFGVECLPSSAGLVDEPLPAASTEDLAVGARPPLFKASASRFGD